MPKIFYLKHWQIILLIYVPATAFAVGFWVFRDTRLVAALQFLRSFWIQAGLVIWFWEVGHYLYRRARNPKVWQLLLFRVSLLSIILIECFDLVALLQSGFSIPLPGHMLFAGLTDRLLLYTFLPIFYRAFFVTRYFKRQEVRRRYSGPAAPVFIALLLSPLGILVLQPELNRLVAHADGQTMPGGL